MIEYISFRGIITTIQNFDPGEFGVGCSKMVSIQNEEGVLVNFIMTPETYVLYQHTLTIGDVVTAYYDGNKPAILIYPPQYHALVIVPELAGRFVKVSQFNNELISTDNMLQLNMSPRTLVTTTNGQSFTNSIINRDLIVIYGASTKSIPAQTTPFQVVVLC